MTAKTIIEFLETFKWGNLCKMHGSSHSSIIGFISSTWIDQSYSNEILDGVPAPSKGRGRKHADSILYKQKKPYVVVEVESGEYDDKIRTIQKYMKNKEDFAGLKFGLLVMLNVYNLRNGKDWWDKRKDKIKKMDDSIALVFLEKNKAKFGKSSLDCLRKENQSGYYSKDIVRIKYCVHTPNEYEEGTLYPKNEK